MADAAFDWAAKNQLVRTNEVHQEQEAKLILEDGFSFDQVEGDKMEQKSRVEVEDCRWLVSRYIDACILIIRACIAETSPLGPQLGNDGWQLHWYHWP